MRANLAVAPASRPLAAITLTASSGTPAQLPSNLAADIAEPACSSFSHVTSLFAVTTTQPDTELAGTLAPASAPSDPAGVAATFPA